MTNKEELIKIANYKMPFGKFEGYFLIHIPEPYYVWYKGKGFPKGKLGEYMQIVLELKINGLENLLTPLIKDH